MKKPYLVLGLLCAVILSILLLSLSACGAAGAPQAASASEETSSAAAGPTAAPTEAIPVETPDAAPDSTESTESAKILVAYFSATGNTRPIAETIAELTGGDLFEIVPAEPYTEADLNYSGDSCRANLEQNDSTARPEISGTVENMADYDIVLIGHPIWWGEEPRIIDTFLESYDFSGKIAVNFCTSGGSGVSASTQDLKALSPDANWLEGHRFETGADAETVQAWLDGLNIIS